MVGAKTMTVSCIVACSVWWWQVAECASSTRIGAGVPLELQCTHVVGGQ